MSTLTPAETAATVAKKAAQDPLKVPEARFEQSYLNSIKKCIHTRPAHGSTQPDENSGNAMHMKDRRRVVDTIDWEKIAWITVRDQVISPLLQGLLL